jgi:hypothetical protein
VALSQGPEYRAESPAPTAMATAAHSVQGGEMGSLAVGRRYQSTIGNPSAASASTTIETALTPLKPIPNT